MGITADILRRWANIGLTTRINESTQINHYSLHILPLSFYFWVTGKFSCLYAEDNARQAAPCTACRRLLVPRCAAGLLSSPSIFQCGDSKTAGRLLEKIDVNQAQLTVIWHCSFRPKHAWKWKQMMCRLAWRQLGQLRLVEPGAAVCGESSHFLVQWHPPPPADPTIRLYFFNHVISWPTGPSGLIIMTSKPLWGHYLLKIVPLGRKLGE